MSELNRVGKNIKTLRKIHGDSQADLAKAVYTDQAAVSHMESGEYRVTDQTIENVSRHYMLSSDEMVKRDIPEIEMCKSNADSVFKRVRMYFPYVESHSARENSDFRHALRTQKQIYDRVCDGRFFEIGEIPACMELYDSAYLDSRASLDSAVNYTGLLYLFTLSTQVTAYILDALPSTFLKKYTDKSTHELSGKVRDDMCRVGEQLSSITEKASFGKNSRRLFCYLGNMLESERHSQIGEFYLASGYIYNILGHSSDSETNRNVGLEMMNTLYLSGNPYASRFFLCK